MFAAKTLPGWRFSVISISGALLSKKECGREALYVDVTGEA